MGRGYDGSSQTQIRPASVNTPDEKTRERARRHAAVRVVATRATDVDDFLRLLDLLGLNPSEGRAP